MHTYVCRKAWIQNFIARLCLTPKNETIQKSINRGTNTMEYYLAFENNDILVFLQHGWALTTAWCQDEPRHKRPLMVRFCSYEMPRIGMATGTGSRLVVAGLGKRRVVPNGVGFLRGWWKCSGNTGGGGCTALWIYRIFKVLNGIL